MDYATDLASAWQSCLSAVMCHTACPYCISHRDTLLTKNGCMLPRQRLCTTAGSHSASTTS